MASDAGELFVRVRPDTAGFKDEASDPVSSAGKDLAKLFVAAFAIGAVGLAEVIKKSVEAAVQNQQAFATLGKAVTNVGAAHEVAGKSIQTVIDKQAELKGFSTTDLAQAFTTLVTDTHNTAKAFQDLIIAENAARLPGQNLESAASAIGRAYEGSANALRSFGVVVTPVKTAVEALADSHNQASVALTTAAEQQDKVLTGQEGIAELAQRTAGLATNFAKQAAGQWDILKVSVDSLAVELGTQLLPVLDDVAVKVEAGANAFTHSAAAQRDVRAAGQDVITGLKDIESVAETVGPTLLTVAEDAKDVVSAIGSGPFLAVGATLATIAAGYKTVALAQGLYAAALKANAGAEAGTLSETAALTGALTANTAALRGQSLATTAAAGSLAEMSAAYAAVDVEAAEFQTLLPEQAAELGLLIGQLEAYSVALGEVTASETAATGAGAFGKGLFALAGGGTTLAIAGVAALAGGIVYLDSKLSSFSSVEQAATGAIGPLTAALQQQATATTSLERAAAKSNVAAAMTKETQALDGLSAAYQFYNGIGDHTTATVQKFDLELGNLQAQLGKNDPLLTHNISLIGQLTAVLGAVPSTVDINLLFNNKDPNAELSSLIAGISTLNDPSLLLSGDNLPSLAQSGQANVAANLPHGSSDVGGGFETALQYAAQQAKASVASGPVHDTLTAAAKATIVTLQQAIAADTADQQLLDTQMADAVQQGAIAIQQAVNEAKQNFVTIGSDIATSIGTYIDTPLTLASNALQLQSDQIALQYDTLTNQLTLSSDLLSTQQAAISLDQQSINAKFAAQSAALTEQQDQIGVRSAALAFENERKSIVIGGKPLSTNFAEAERQLDQYLRRAPASVQPIIQSEIDAFTTSHIALAQARVTLAEHIRPEQAARAAGLTTAQDRNTVKSDQIKQRQDALTFADQRKKDALTVETDIATIEKTAAANSIADWQAEWLAKKITLQQFNRDVAQLIKEDVGQLGDISKIPGGLLLEEQLKAQLSAVSTQAQAINAVPTAGTGLSPSIDYPLTTLQQTQVSIADIAKSQRADALTKLQDNNKISQQILDVLKNPPAGVTRTSLARNPGEQSRLIKSLSGVPG